MYGKKRDKQMRKRERVTHRHSVYVKDRVGGGGKKGTDGDGTEHQTYILTCIIAFTWS